MPDYFNPGFTGKYDCENNAYFSMCNFNCLIIAPLVCLSMHTMKIHIEVFPYSLFCGEDWHLKFYCSCSSFSASNIITCPIVKQKKCYFKFSAGLRDFIYAVTLLFSPTSEDNIRKAAAESQNVIL